MPDSKYSLLLSPFLDPPGLSWLGSSKGANLGMLKKIGVGDYPAQVLPHPDHPALPAKAASPGWAVGECRVHFCVFLVLYCQA
jgi:hypothetical protein